MKGASKSEWIEAVGQVERLSTVVPDGFKTLKQIADEIGRTTSATHHLVAQLIREGRAEMRKFRIPTPGRGLYPTQHYRVIKSKP